MKSFNLLKINQFGLHSEYLNKYGLRIDKKELFRTLNCDSYLK